MRSINDARSSLETHGNTNGTYDQMQKNISSESRERFRRKPWYLVAAEKLKMRERSDVMEEHRDDKLREAEVED